MQSISEDWKKKLVGKEFLAISYQPLWRIALFISLLTSYGLRELYTLHLGENRISCHVLIGGFGLDYKF